MYSKLKSSVRQITKVEISLNINSWHSRRLNSDVCAEILVICQVYPRRSHVLSTNYNNLLDILYIVNQANWRAKQQISLYTEFLGADMKYLENHLSLSWWWWKIINERKYILERFHEIYSRRTVVAHVTEIRSSLRTSRSVAFGPSTTDFVRWSPHHLCIMPYLMEIIFLMWSVFEKVFF